MALTDEIKRGVVSSCFTIVIAILGFYVGDTFSEFRDYENYKMAIKVEAVINDTLLAQSFNDNNIDKRTILRDFETAVVQAALANKSFINHCSEKNMQKISRYLLNLKRMNGFKHFAELSLSNVRVDSLYNLEQVSAWKRTRDLCKKDTEDMIGSIN